MVKLFSERSLPLLQAVGMLGVSLLVTLGTGGWFSMTFIDHFEKSLGGLEHYARETQDALLTRQTAALIKQLEHRKSETDALLRDNLRIEVDRAVIMAQTMVDTLSGTIDRPQLERLILESLRPVRFFDGRGYYFVLRPDGTSLLQPITPHHEGRSQWNLRDPKGVYLIRELARIGQSSAGGGFARYAWYPPEGDAMRDKIAYVRHFAPFDWLIGSGDYLYKAEEDVQARVLTDIRAVRFGTSGYFMVLDGDGTVLVAPSRPEMEGEPIAALPDVVQTPLAQILAAAADGNARAGEGGDTEPGAGSRTMTVEWPELGGQWAIPRLIQVTVFRPWNWIVVASIDAQSMTAAIDRQRVQLRARVDEQIRDLIGVSLVVLLVSGGLAALFGGWSHRLLTRYRADLEARSHELAENERRLRLAARVFDCANEAVVVTDPRNRIVAANPAFGIITGYDPLEVIGRSLRFLSCNRHDERFFLRAWRSLIKRGTWAGEIWIRRKDDTSFPAWVSLSLTRESDGSLSHHIGTFSDITQRKDAEERIRQLAFYDPLTQLPNRRLLRTRLRQALAAAEHLGQRGALLFLDLDNFKTVNDTRGHDTGDRLLIQVAERLRDAVRERDIVARLGGDEFVVILGSLGREEEEAAGHVERVGDHLLATLAVPVVLDGESYVVTPSIGACLFTGPQDGVDTVLQHADAAMYLAKSRGRNRLCFFEPAIQEALMRRSRMEAALRAALDREEGFFLLYQPQVDYAGRIIGTEALVRWRHPDQGVLPPGEFIPLAEETGLIVRLGRWVLEEAVRQVRSWRAQGLARTLSVSVNVSAKQFREPDFVAMVLDTIDRHGLPAGSLKLELTESLVVEDVAGAIATMTRLKQRGVGFSMDDFGTGYSSLSFLKRLPLDQLKIDKSFVDDVTRDPNDAVIVRTIIAMASSLGLDVLAEGVETPEQKAFLIANHCRNFQGYLFSRPLSPDDFAALLRRDDQTNGVGSSRDG